ncbi:DUF4419 domain-containing protein [Kibdelosporangium philippinense]|uniref:DUF4419 domain-containing protein n=1 Tax=Kibdelosporangium philippinense TaxID=211113 RepID=A0ABS8Z367_9PSEU|nr:DUF4419 domain-containing protein [Kibdelosporangium philippinense]MCE7001792.1 DUF4419 domain-containing protein [Kibdelosporangium philippinense]
MANPLLALPIADLWEAKRRIPADRVPRTLAKATVTINDEAVALYGGLVAVAQGKDGALRPTVGWHLTPAAV